MSVDYTALKAEFVLNTALMPYPPLLPENDVANADVINNHDGSNPRTVNNDVVDTGDVRGNTTFAGFDGLTTAKQAWFEWLTVNGVVPVNAETLQQLAGIPVVAGSIWAVSDRTAMNAVMKALMQRQGSRAEEIKDTIGTSFVTPSDVANARNLV